MAHICAENRTRVRGGQETISLSISLAISTTSISGKWLLLWLATAIKKGLKLRRKKANDFESSLIGRGGGQQVTDVCTHTGELAKRAIKTNTIADQCTMHLNTITGK
jgi:hypothetical protein